MDYCHTYVYARVCMCGGMFMYALTIRSHGNKCPIAENWSKENGTKTSYPPLLIFNAWHMYIHIMYIEHVPVRVTGIEICMLMYEWH